MHVGEKNYKKALQNFVKYHNSVIWHLADFTLLCKIRLTLLIPLGKFQKLILQHIF